MKINIFFAFVIGFSVAQKSNAHSDLDYFKDNFLECDKSFMKEFSILKKTNLKAEIHEFQYSEGLIKSFYLPAKNPKSGAKNLLIMISGTHGIEGFTGSAVQRYLLDQNINKNMSVLMVHGFNLYGFKNFRRVNESNIDLNRNFVLNREMFKPDDQKYGLITHFLNPDSQASSGFFSHVVFIISSVRNILYYGMETLRSSILKGQYTYPAGVFYGGDKTQIQSFLILDLIKEYVKDYKKVLIVDLHTGYGERAKLHLLAGRSTEQNSLNLLKIYNKDEIDFADKKNFYAVEGEMLNYFIDKIKLNVDAEVAGVTFEYGTLDSQKTLGSVESLRRVVLENQNFHHPTEASESEKIKTLYKEMFYPSDIEWRKSVLLQTDDKMKKIFNYFN
ncbi:MAG: M14 family metallopeptidase [Pseudobdellovibrio sp.]